MNTNGEALTAHIQSMLAALEARFGSLVGGRDLGAEVSAFLAASSDLPRHAGYKFVPAEARARVDELAPGMVPDRVQLFL